MCVSLYADDVLSPFPAAIRNLAGNLLASPLDRYMTPDPNRIFHLHAQASARAVFERRRRNSRSSFLISPQNVDASHQGDP